MIHAGDPRLAAAFETQYEKSMSQPNSGANTETEQNKEVKEASQQPPTPEQQIALIKLAAQGIVAQLMAEKEELTKENNKLLNTALRLLTETEKLTEENEQLLIGADQVLKQRIEELSQKNAQQNAQHVKENAQHMKARRNLFWILLGSTAATGSFAIPKVASLVVTDVKDPNGVSRSQLIPNFIDDYVRESELNKVFAQTTACGIKMEIGARQLIEACYQTLNQSPKIDQENVRLLLKNLIVAMLTREGIKLTEDKILLKMPNNIDLVRFDQAIQKTIKEIDDKQIELAQQQEQKQAFQAKLDLLKQAVHNAQKKVHEKKLEMKKLDGREAEVKGKLWDDIANAKQYTPLKKELDTIQKAQLAHEDALVAVCNQLETAQRTMSQKQGAAQEKITQMDTMLDSTHKQIEALQHKLEADKKTRAEKAQAAIILHRSQILEAGCETVAEWAHKFTQKQKTDLKTLSRDFAQKVGTEVGYNAVVQLIHMITEKTNTNINAVNHILPKDCKPKDLLSFYAKMLIRWGIATGTPILVQYIPIAAQYIISSMFHICPDAINLNGIC